MCPTPQASPFSRLPLALRLRIWRATWEVRHVRLVHTVRRIRADNGPAISITTTTAPPPPSSLHVNRESRRETLRHYEVAFQVQGGFSHVWFNYDLDILELPPPARTLGHSLGIMRFRDFSRLRKVSLRGDIFDHRRGLLDGDGDGDSGSGHDGIVGGHPSSSTAVGEWFVPTRSAMTNPSLMTLLMPNLCEIWLGGTRVWSGSGAWPLLSVAY